ncbi:hypothetical protein DEO72_LG9g2666 [Vigna unguiculata]|uniref:Uncharacterized protein n=1 Tax=Vigna unguiculata TaxID=3917 RepID=A0A4D6N1K0_VIGUN|nr:hypothetical protein DEO72_LG9g2666 [Vigna unguiculata]
MILYLNCNSPPPCELLSPKRKHQEMHLCSCAKSRLGELGSPERESDLVWANQPSLSENSPRFFFLPLLVPRLGETDSPERDDLSPKLDFLA